MATVATCKPEKKRRVLLLEEKGAGQDPDVWEMDDDQTVRGDSGRHPEKLHKWLAAKKMCTCEPQRNGQAELTHQIETLARSNLKLEQFAYTASHDLREPLRMIATYTQLLAERYRNKLDKSADQYIDYATDGALRMQALIEDLMALARITADAVPNQSVDGGAVMEQVLRDLEPAIRQASAVVHCGKLPVIRAHRTSIFQLFLNLISNAVKFRSQGPPVVSVNAVPSGALWNFSVTDNGIGIAPDSHEDVFGAFQRLHTRAEYPGNGVGLAICKKVVETYGGKIWIESQLGSGSTFHFTLPAQEAQPS